MSKGRFFVVLSIICLAFVGASCSSEPEQSTRPSAYDENVEIDLELRPSEDLTNFDREDLLFAVANNGDKSITRLKGDIIFSNSEYQEVGRTAWLFIWADEGMEKIAAADKKPKHRPLQPGATLEMGVDVLYLFAGNSELREKLLSQWDDLTAEVAITEVITN